MNFWVFSQKKRQWLPQNKLNHIGNDNEDGDNPLERVISRHDDHNHDEHNHKKHHKGPKHGDKHDDNREDDLERDSGDVHDGHDHNDKHKH